MMSALSYNAVIVRLLFSTQTFVFLIFWYQLYCGFSGSVMIDQIYLMLYNLLFTSLPPLAIGVYDKVVSEELLLATPYLYRYVSTYQLIIWHLASVLLLPLIFFIDDVQPL